MILSPASFATIVGYILREGDRQTYCNMYNHNPHVTVAGFRRLPSSGHRAAQHQLRPGTQRFR